MSTLTPTLPPYPDLSLPAADFAKAHGTFLERCLEVQPIADLPDPVRFAVESHGPSPHHAVYYRRSGSDSDGGAIYFIRDWAYQRRVRLTFHNDEARYVGASHFAVWNPDGSLRYNGPVLNALGRPPEPLP